MLRRRLIGAVKYKLMLALVFFGITVFGIAVQILDPVKTPAGTSKLVDAEIAAALREGRAPDVAQFEPFDNYWVINYLIPLFAIWILCKFARRRNRLPVSVFAVLAGLWFAISPVWSPGAELLLFPVLVFVGFDRVDPTDASTFINLLFPALALALAGFVLWLLLRMLVRVAGWLDNILRGQRAQSGNRQRGAAADSGRSARLWLYASSLAMAPVLWWLYDWIDGGGIPGPFAMSVRGLFVVFSLWLMARPQIDLAWPIPGLPREETGFEPDPEFDDIFFGA